MGSWRMQRGGADRLAVPRNGDRFGIHYDPEGFGRFSERIAHTIGTGRFLMVQTVAVAAWLGWNALAPGAWRFDPPSFILLNLAFSTQAAYAAPLILLAETRQAERDRQEAAADRLRADALKADLDYLARELVSVRLGSVDPADLARIEAKLDRLLADRAPLADPA
jgi:uncharacterized membrane protein